MPDDGVIVYDFTEVILSSITCTPPAAQRTYVELLSLSDGYNSANEIESCTSYGNCSVNTTCESSTDASSIRSRNSHITIDSGYTTDTRVSNPKALATDGPIRSTDTHVSNPATGSQVESTVAISLGRLRYLEYLEKNVSTIVDTAVRRHYAP